MCSLSDALPISEVQQVGQDIEQRRFLSATLRRRRRKGGADLAGQQALRPDTAGGVPETRHLARHAAEARRGADDDRIILRSEEHTSELQSLMRISYAVF